MLRFFCHFTFFVNILLDCVYDLTKHICRFTLFVIASHDIKGFCQQDARSGRWCCVFIILTNLYELAHKAMVNEGRHWPSQDKMTELRGLVVNSGSVRFVRFQISFYCHHLLCHHLLFAWDLSFHIIYFRFT